MNQQVKISVVETDRVQKSMTLQIRNCSVEFVNALRRTVMDDVPTLAIDRVEIVRNDTPLSDEMLAHRLGLIPIVCPYEQLQQYKATSECECVEGCETCGFRYRLSVQNQSDRDPLTITSAHIELVDKVGPAGTSTVLSTPLGASPDSDVPPVPIAKLPPHLPDTSMPPPAVTAVCHVSKGCGIMHAKWMPGLAAYQPIPRIMISPNAEFSEKAITKLAGARGVPGVCPARVFTTVNEGGVRRVVVAEGGETACVLCGECTSPVRMADAIPEKLQAEAVANGVEPRVVHVIPSDTDFIFTIESHGTLQCEQILTDALDRLSQRANAVRGSLQHAIA